MTSSRRFRTLNLSWLNYVGPKRKILADRPETYFKKHAGRSGQYRQDIGRNPAVGQFHSLHLVVFIQRAERDPRRQVELWDKNSPSLSPCNLRIDWDHAGAAPPFGNTPNGVHGGYWHKTLS